MLTRMTRAHARRLPLSIALCVVTAFPLAACAQNEPVRPAPADAPTTPLGEIVSRTGPSVKYVYQSANGDHWFGSNDAGVYRYDGKTLVRFTTKDGLASDRVDGIEEDAQGNLYFTTYEGVSRFDGRGFTTLPVADGPTSDWKKEPGDLWFVGPPDQGIVYRFDGTALHRLAFPSTPLGDAHFVNMPRDKFPNAKYNPYDVYSILRDSKGNVWFGTTCVGVCRYDGKEFRWLTDRVLAAAPVRSILEDRDGNYWFSYSGQGTIEGARPVEGFAAVQDGATGAIIAGMSIAEGDDGHLWTAASRAGAFRFDGERAVNYPIRDGDTPIQVFTISKDRGGVLWLGTHNGGAYRWNGDAFEPFRP